MDDRVKENVAEENAFGIVKTEMVDSFDDQQTAAEKEIREKDAMPSMAIQDSINVSIKNVQIRTLHRNEVNDNIFYSELTKLPRTNKKQSRKKTIGKGNQTKFETPESSGIANKEDMSNSSIMPYNTTVDKQIDIKSNEKVEAEYTVNDSENNDIDSTTSIGTIGQMLDKDSSRASLKIYKCDICDKAYEIYGRLVRHRVIHSEDGNKTYRHECAKCGDTFIRKNQLGKHMTTHNREDQTVYTCEICSKSYTRKQDLQFHKDTVHNEDARFSCEVCGRWFTSARFLKIHTVKQTCTKLYKCEICGDAFPRLNTLTKHRAKHTEKEYICKTCGKHFPNDSNLRRHMFQHSDTIFSCEFCGKIFKTPYSLKDHVVVHTKEKRHICHLCGEGFGHSSGLRLHTMKHTGQKPYTCATCGKSFPTSSRLRGHSFVHGQIELHKCHLCKNVFRKEENLLKHLLSHTESNTET